MSVTRRLLLAARGGSSYAPGGDVALGWINVKDYGAVGDGSNDDTSAVNLAIAALNTAARGVLYFPPGRYKVTSALTAITAGATVAGCGRGAESASTGVTGSVSQIDFTSTTGVLLTFTGLSARVEGITLKCTGTATAGAAVQASGSDYRQKVDLHDVLVYGFYIGYDCQVNGGFRMAGCDIVNSVLYGVKVQNTVNGDAGGASIEGCRVFSDSPTAAAGLYIASSGGNKITATNIAQCQHAVQLLATAASSILLIIECSLENYTGDGVHLDGNGHGYNMVSVLGTQFGQYSNGTGRAVYATGVDNVTVSGCIFRANTGTPTAISLNSGARGFVGPMVNDGFGTLLATSSFTSLLDHSNS